MSAALQADVTPAARLAPRTRLSGLVLVRLAAGAADVRQLARDTQAPGGAAGDARAWNETVGREMLQLVTDGLAGRRTEHLFEATAAGRAAAAAFLGLRQEAELDDGWPAVRDGALLALAVGVSGAGAKRRKGLAKTDGLRLAIVMQAWGLKVRGTPTPARVRHALALAALARAFGNTLKTALGAKTELSPKASRLLAGQLAREPRDYGTDARLIATLAGEAVGCARADHASLRQAAVRAFFAQAAEPAAARSGPTPRPVAAPAPAPAGPSAAMSPASAIVAGRPDPQRFAAIVREAAKARAEGWAGNRRAFVSQVWQLIQERQPGWALSEIEFKSMLTEAHRAGLIVLANADLKDKRRMDEVQASAVPYKNTVWHYIRVED